MIDIKPFIAERLRNIAPVELSFGEVGRKLPVICITETGNSAEIVLEGEDRVSRLTIQLDLYADTPGQAEELAVRVNGELTAAGLKRGFSQLITDGDVPRRCMRYTCGVDEADGRIMTL